MERTKALTKDSTTTLARLSRQLSCFRLLYHSWRNYKDLLWSYSKEDMIGNGQHQRNWMMMMESRQERFCRMIWTSFILDQKCNLKKSSHRTTCIFGVCYSTALAVHWCIHLLACSTLFNIGTRKLLLWNTIEDQAHLENCYRWIQLSLWKLVSSCTSLWHIFSYLMMAFFQVRQLFSNMMINTQEASLLEFGLSFKDTCPRSTPNSISLHPLLCPYYTLLT